MYFSLLRTLVKSKHSTQANSKTHNLAHEFVLHTDINSIEFCFVLLCLPPDSSIYSSLFHISFHCLFVCCCCVFVPEKGRKSDRHKNLCWIYIHSLELRIKMYDFMQRIQILHSLNDSMTWFFISSFSECAIPYSFLLVLWLLPFFFFLI